MIANAFAPNYLAKQGETPSRRRYKGAPGGTGSAEAARSAYCREKIQNNEFRIG
jgi:hypothetical protein